MIAFYQNLQRLNNIDISPPQNTMTRHIKIANSQDVRRDGKNGKNECDLSLNERGKCNNTHLQCREISMQVLRFSGWPDLQRPADNMRN